MSGLRQQGTDSTWKRQRKSSSRASSTEKKSKNSMASVFKMRIRWRSSIHSKSAPLATKESIILGGKWRTSPSMTLWKVQLEKGINEVINLINVPIYYCFYVSSADFEYWWAHSNLSVTLHSTETYATVVRFHPDGTPISPHEKLSKPNEIDWGSTRASNTHMDTHFSIILRATTNTNV